MASSIADEKQISASDVEFPNKSSLNSPTTFERVGGDLDEAYVFLTQHNQGDGTVDLKALRRKIDWRIVPIMFLCYTMQFVDKVMVNYAAVMGISKELKLKGNNFSNVGSAFFIAYLIAEVPNGYILQKVGVARWLGVNVILWGIATACHAAAFNYHSLLAARIFLGIFESAIAPCLMLISSQWYTKSEQAPRFSFWYCGLGAGQILRGLVSFGFQHVKGDFAGWKVMFIVMGLTTSLIGVAAFWILPDTPMKATFLSDAEKTALLEHVAVNQTGIENHQFKWSHLKEIILDIQIWLMVFITILISVSSGVITTYSATLINGFGYTKPQSALLNMPGGIVSIASTLIVGFGIRHTSHRWAWIVVCCVPGMIGGGLMSFSPMTNRAALLAGIYLVNSIVATLVIIYQWTVANCAGHTKRTVSAAIIAGSFSIGNIIGPQTFQGNNNFNIELMSSDRAATMGATSVAIINFFFCQRAFEIALRVSALIGNLLHQSANLPIARDAPGYRPAKITVMATQGAGAVVTIILFLYYVWANKKKDHKQTSDTVESHNWENQTDKENEGFRYVY